MKKIINLSKSLATVGLDIDHKIIGILSKKRKGVDGLMIAIALVVIGIAIAYLFKNSMSNSMNELLNKATTALSGMLDGISG